MRGTSLRNQKRGSRDNCLLKKQQTRGNSGATQKAEGEQRQQKREKKQQQTRGHLLTQKLRNQNFPLQPGEANRQTYKT